MYLVVKRNYYTVSIVNTVVLCTTLQTWFDLVEGHLVEEHVVWDIVRSAQSASRLIVSEDSLEARSMSIKKQLVAGSVVETQSLQPVA